MLVVGYEERERERETQGVTGFYRVFSTNGFCGPVSWATRNKRRSAFYRRFACSIAASSTGRPVDDTRKMFRRRACRHPLCVPDRLFNFYFFFSSLFSLSLSLCRHLISIPPFRRGASAREDQSSTWKTTFFPFFCCLLLSIQFQGPHLFTARLRF